MGTVANRGVGATWFPTHRATFDTEIVVDASTVEPQVSWGTSPEMVVSVNDVVPDPDAHDDETKRVGMRNALAYMDLQPGLPITSIPVDIVFIGSCTNSRIEDLRAAAEVAKGRSRATNVKAVLVVPGSGLVKQQAEAEGLDQNFFGRRFRDGANQDVRCVSA